MVSKKRAAALSWPRRFAEYSPAELASISELSPGSQRTWRFQKYLPPVDEGHARYSPQQVIEISIRYALTKLGVSAAKSMSIDARAISGAMYHALLGHHGSCEVIGPPRDVDRFLEDSEWPDFAFVLAEEPRETNYLIWDDEDGVRIIDDPQRVFDRRTVSVIAIDLAIIGGRLMDRGRKPIITLEAPKSFTEEHVRRLTGLADR